ncbi:ferredoxin [Kitasatospora sp. NPDC058170]|uniref:ferredoxin n=1 Tax=Kitasatospora sp. NPDC058170 TaxID=3346364 RepID=UPI0036DBDFF8
MTAEHAVPAGAPASGSLVVVRVDRDRCVGSGMCVLTAPRSLELGADGLAHPLRGDAGEEPTDELSEAVEFCPVEALAVHSAHDGRARDGRPAAPSS